MKKLSVLVLLTSLMGCSTGFSIDNIAEEVKLIALPPCTDIPITILEHQNPFPCMGADGSAAMLFAYPNANFVWYVSVKRWVNGGIHVTDPKELLHRLAPGTVEAPPAAQVPNATPIPQHNMLEQNAPLRAMPEQQTK